MTERVRIRSLDASRGLAIFLMIEGHLAVVVQGTFLNGRAIDLAAPFFLIVAGIGFELFFRSRIGRGHTKQEIFLESFSRASVLFLITLLPYLFATMILPGRFPWDGVLKWSIFQVIAVGYVVGCFLCGRFAARVLAIGVVFVLTSVANASEPVKSLTEGVFPLLPFLAYFLAGQAIAEIYRSDVLSRLSNKALIALSVTPLAIILTLYACPETHFSISARDTIPAFVLICSMQFYCLVGFILLADRSRIQRILTPLEGVGRIAFSAYYIHFAVILLLDIILSALQFTIGADASGALVGIILLILIMYGLAILESSWRKYEYWLGLEWILRRASQELVRLTSPRRERP